ncbi:hypothetical protein G7092_16825 [Mucilaginibacter sp. HC2]|uniref:hypothetical protein n=1 Tax=Mucilaginibacter TaxID=423349 RepID=UPI00101A8785|nr:MULTISPECIES: hypothetical protein [Mucilaginibacter]NHA05476.1 hypothetical protein [Mucilaginibacter inviolabilis]QTE35284.1 hypothetical protein J3L18_19300 [Mucilaginibacter gossypii]
MKAIVRNILLACLISMFAFFGAVGRKHSKEKMTPEQRAEARKETLTCLSVAFIACGLCAWRCSVLSRRLNEEREYQRRFNEYMRNSAFNRHY